MNRIKTYKIKSGSVSVLSRNAATRDSILSWFNVDNLRLPDNRKLIIPPLQSCNTPQRIGMMVDYFFKKYLSFINSEVYIKSYMPKFESGIRFEMFSGNYCLNKKHVKHNGTNITWISSDMLNFIVSLHTGWLTFDPTPSIDDESSQEVEHLRKILYSIPLKKFMAKKRIITERWNPELNFQFDLLLDKSVIEIKTIKDFKIHRKDLCQLLLYHILYNIGGIGNERVHLQTDTIGIYFARHCYLWKVKVSDLISDSKKKLFIKWYKKQFLTEVIKKQVKTNETH